MESFHELDIHSPEPMPGWGEEVETDVDPVIRDGDPVDPGLCLKEQVKLLIHILCYWLPAACVVHTITKTYKQY